MPAALLSLCEWWVGLTAEERSGLLAAAELAEIDRKVDAAVLGAGDLAHDVDVLRRDIEPPFPPTDEEGRP